jgi:hypothetical protein
MPRNRVARGPFLGREWRSSTRCSRRIVYGSINALADLTSLTYLNLRINQITSIPANALADLTSLTSLNLGFNQITSAHADALGGLTSLTSLNLHGNQIASIPALAELTRLEIIWLMHNQITSIPANALAGLNMMLELFLDNNQITSIPADALADLTRLERLGLDNNRIGMFDYSSLAPMPALSFLSLESQVGGDLRCGGKDVFDAAGIQAAVAACGASGSPCGGCAVACPADDPSKVGECAEGDGTEPFRPVDGATAGLIALGGAMLLAGGGEGRLRGSIIIEPTQSPLYRFRRV